MFISTRNERQLVVHVLHVLVNEEGDLKLANNFSKYKFYCMILMAVTIVTIVTTVTIVTRVTIVTYVSVMVSPQCGGVAVTKLIIAYCCTFYSVK